MKATTVIVVDHQPVEWETKFALFMARFYKAAGREVEILDEYSPL